MKSLSANGGLNLLVFSSLLSGGFSFQKNGIVRLPTTTLKIHPPRLGRTTPSSNNMVSLSQGESTETTSNTPIISNKKKKVKVGLASDTFLKEYFNSDIDDMNLPPSLSIIKRSIGQLAQGSDIRGRFMPNHHIPSSSSSSGRRQHRSWASLAHDIGQSTIPALTPFAAHCLGYAFGMMVKEEMDQRREDGTNNNNDDVATICIGRDPRQHGVELADAFSRGAGGVPNVRVLYTGIATTPAMFEFCRSSLCDGSVMVTASHLPSDRNGMKFFTTRYGGFQKSHIQRMIGLAQEHAQVWFNMGIIPPSSGPNTVFCNEFVHWMPYYQQQLESKLLQQVVGSAAPTSSSSAPRPLEGLKIVLNPGNGSGGFFQQVLQSLGANVEGSINVTPDPSFPFGIPNPENERMVDETIRACELAHADLGILLDTDADRCGIVAPRHYYKPTTNSGTTNNQQEYQPTDYEPINKNRLIALMGVIYARQSPGCAIVTDSVTSNGLATFLENDLGLTHIRYLRGYANVIQKAQSVIEQGIADAEVAIETSGHCAVRENGFLDDGTFTAVKVLGLLAQERMMDDPSSSAAPPKSILDLISNLQELDEVIEFRLPVLDGSTSTIGLFDFVALEVEALCDERDDWTVDRANLEGIRVSTGESGGYFLLRKSLHDPVFCLQVEASSKDDAKQSVVQPLLQMIQSESRIASSLDASDLEQYIIE